MKKDKDLDLKSVVWKEGEYYISQCLDVDVSSFGKTRKEALSMLQDALVLYFAKENSKSKKCNYCLCNPIACLVRIHLELC